MGLLDGGLSDVQPAIKVAAGIVARHLIDQHKTLSTHLSTKGQTTKRVIESLLDTLHTLLANRSIKDGLISIMMEESNGMIIGNDAVVEGL